MTKGSTWRIRLVGAIGIALAAVWAFIRSGASVSPGASEAYRTALIWPNGLTDGLSSFYVDSALGIFLFRGLQLTSEKSFLLLNVVVTIIALFLFSIWASRATLPGMRARATRLFLLAPLPAVLFTWIGFYDAYTVLAWGIALFAWSSGVRPLMIGAGVLLGLQHFEQSLAGLIALTLVWFAVREVTSWGFIGLERRTPLWLLPGMLAGKLVLVIVLTTSGGEASNRAEWVSEYLRDWTITAINVGPLLLWSLFAGTWAIVIAWWLNEKNRQSRALALLAFGIGAAALVLSGDRPRVFVIVVAPALLLLTISLLNTRRMDDRSWRLVEPIVWLAPPLAFWGSDIVNQIALDHLIMTWNTMIGFSLPFMP